MAKERPQDEAAEANRELSDFQYEVPTGSYSQCISDCVGNGGGDETSLGFCPVFVHSEVW